MTKSIRGDKRLWNAQREPTKEELDEADHRLKELVKSSQSNTPKREKAKEEYVPPEIKAGENLDLDTFYNTEITEEYVQRGAESMLNSQLQVDEKQLLDLITAGRTVIPYPLISKIFNVNLPLKTAKHWYHQFLQLVNARLTQVKIGVTKRALIRGKNPQTGQPAIIYEGPALTLMRKPVETQEEVVGVQTVRLPKEIVEEENLENKNLS